MPLKRQSRPIYLQSRLSTATLFSNPDRQLTNVQTSHGLSWWGGIRIFVRRGTSRRYMPLVHVLTWMPLTRQSVASSLIRYAKLGLGEINAVVLTDGEDNRSSGCWLGIGGAIHLMRLARHLGTSLTISFVQLGGSSKDVATTKHPNGGQHNRWSLPSHQC